MHATAPPRRPLDRKTKVALIAFVIALIGSLAALATWSAFSSTTANAGNDFSTGTVTLSDNDSNQAMFTMTNATPSDPAVVKCITVSYTGTLTSNVRLYGATTAGNGLNSYLDLKVTRGTWAGGSTPPANMACSNGTVSFQADTATFSGGNGAGANGVMFNARMNNYPTTWAAGILDAPDGTNEAWTNPESHVYKFEVSVAADNNAAGKNHTQTFTWEAQNT